MRAGRGELRRRTGPAKHDALASPLTRTQRTPSSVCADERRMIMSSRRWLPIATGLLAAVAAVIVGVALAGGKDSPGATKGLGQLTGLLPRDHLTVESALQVDLDKESVRLPLYKGEANGETVWFVLLDASDQGLAHDLGVNYAPKLANLAIGCPACVQTVTLDSPTPSQNKFGQALEHFQSEPDFSPSRIATPRPNGFPLANFQPGAVAGAGYSPFIRIAGSNTVYCAPIVATGDGPFDVVHHANTGDRVLGIHIAGPQPKGQYEDSWVDLLFVKGFRHQLRRDRVHREGPHSQPRRPRSQLAVPAPLGDPQRDGGPVGPPSHPTERLSLRKAGRLATRRGTRTWRVRPRVAHQRAECPQRGGHPPPACQSPSATSMRAPRSATR